MLDDAKVRGALMVRDASVEFAGLKALDGVSLRLEPGEILGLIGPNGSGKTTTINAITGQVPLAGGTVRIGERIISGLSAAQDCPAGRGAVVPDRAPVQ